MVKTHSIGHKKHKFSILLHENAFFILKKINMMLLVLCCQLEYLVSVAGMVTLSATTAD